MSRTPGPWKYQEDSDRYTHIVRGPLNQFLCSTPQGSMGVDEANARLMAAAPELLDALREAIEVVDDDLLASIIECHSVGDDESTLEEIAKPDVHRYKLLIAKAHVAIGKAEGKL